MKKGTSRLWYQNIMRDIEHIRENRGTSSNPEAAGSTRRQQKPVMLTGACLRFNLVSTFGLPAFVEVPHMFSSARESNAQTQVPANARKGYLWERQEICNPTFWTAT